VRDLAFSGSLPPLPAGLAADAVLEAAREQGLGSQLLEAIEREKPAWAEALVEPLVAQRRALLVRSLGQIGLAARALKLLEDEGIRALPLKGAVLAETVCRVEAERPMSDVDVLALERFTDAVRALAGAGFEEIVRGDHAWAFRDPLGHGILELHRSVVSAPGLFPLDPEGLWARRRPGRAQLRALPSAEDLLLQLALHAAFQHGLVLSLVQWLDFRVVLERERIDPRRLTALADAAGARVPLAAALAVARSVVGAPVPEALAEALPRAVARHAEAAERDPLAFVAPAEPRLARVRWDLAAGRRHELVWRTLVLPETPLGDTRLLARVRFACGRALRLLRRAAKSPTPEPTAHDLGEPPLQAAAGAEVPFGEELLVDCLASFPHVRLTVTGTCMEPALAHGERVHLVSAARRPPRVGDVVLARQKQGLRLHRLVLGPPFLPGWAPWRTKADRGVLLDPPLAAEDVLATIVSVEGRPGARPRRMLRALVSLSRGLVARATGGARRSAEAVS
jgi:hypothetical protein